MRNITVLISIAAIAIIHVFPVYANNAPPTLKLPSNEMPCKYFTLHIRNKTHHQCQLIDSDLGGGLIYRDSIIPDVILSGDDKRFTIRSWNDTFVTLRYQCGAGTVTIKSHKSYCGMMNFGNIYGDVLEFANINATYTKRQSSAYAYGLISWTFSPINIVIENES